MKKNTSGKTFTFWKENNTSLCYSLTEAELINQFKEWLPRKKVVWHEQYPISHVLNCFVAEELTSIGNTENDFAEYREMEKLITSVCCC